ncbi:MAG TPA: hypothetical protein VMA71_04850 [Alloacidobacterium sp.]|nr:hypothetical protein [Alloacidobacterium sp.]
MSTGISGVDAPRLCFIVGVQHFRFPASSDWLKLPLLAYNLFLTMPSKERVPFEVTCPDCGAMLKVDPATRAVIAHTPAPRKRTFEDFETAARAMREQDERKESLFRQAVDAEKNKNDLLEKKFAEALRKAKETRDTGKPLRDFDLD